MMTDGLDVQVNMRGDHTCRLRERASLPAWVWEDTLSTCQEDTLSSHCCEVQFDFDLKINVDLDFATTSIDEH